MEGKEEDSEDSKEIPTENKDPKFQCRFFENEFPEIDEVVMVLYKQVQEHGANVELLEYNKMEGMILANEISRKRTSLVTRHIRIGKKEAAIVLKIDKEKGYMDLSKIKVRGDQSQKCEERYNKAKIVHTILQRTAINCDVPLEKLYKEIVWPLNKLPGQALEAFRLADSLSKDSPTLCTDMFKGLPLSEEIAKELHRQIQNKLSRHAIRIKADFEVTCFTFEGIDAIKEALSAGIQVGTAAIQATAEKGKEEKKKEPSLEVKVKIFIV